MIIVSQDKMNLINFDNIAEITQIDKSIGVSSNLYFDDLQTIAEYETEKRAKEVLQEIIQSYRAYRTAECDGYTNVLEETAIFEMPKE